MIDEITKAIEASVEEKESTQTTEAEEKQTTEERETTNQTTETEDATNQTTETEDATNQTIETEDATEEKHKKSRFQERIDNLTREKYRLKAELEALKQKLEKQEPDLPPQPDPKNYTFDSSKPGDYERALAQYNQDLGKWQAQVDLIKQEYQNREAKRIKEEQQGYMSRIMNQKSIYGDPNDAFETLKNLPLTQELHSALRDSDHPEDLFCFLGSHPDIASQILDMPSYKQIRTLAEIDIKLQEAKKKKQFTQSKPKPQSAPKTEGAVSSEKSLEEMSQEEYEKTMQKLRRKRYG